MGKLNVGWLTEGLIDFEYKQYILLAYIQHVKDDFKEGKLYPELAELVVHYNNLLKFKESKSMMQAYFPKQLDKIQLEKLKLSYSKIIEDDDLMQEIESVVAFALPKLQLALEEGKGIYELVEKNLEIEPIGLMPIYDKEGYMLISQNEQKELDIYRYQLSIFTSNHEQYRAVNTTFIKKERRSIANSLEAIKLNLILLFKDLPNPATYFVNSRLAFPLKETVLPVAQRLLIRQLNV